MSNVEAPDELVDKHGFSIKPPISDKECILICLKNAPCGTDKKQVQRLIELYDDTKKNFNQLRDLQQQYLDEL
jgi:hypothetical protein|tara:strand:- start:342 stop:560 length:219 start_codon:yes stop_codon:yes gene_type:complete